MTDDWRPWSDNDSRRLVLAISAGYLAAAVVAGLFLVVLQVLS